MYMWLAETQCLCSDALASSADGFVTGGQAWARRVNALQLKGFYWVTFRQAEQGGYIFILGVWGEPEVCAAEHTVSGKALQLKGAPYLPALFYYNYCLHLPVHPKYFHY